MPVCMRQQSVVAMEMEVGIAARQPPEDAEPEPDHDDAHRALGERLTSFGKGPAEQEEHGPRPEQDGAMTDGPAQPRPGSAAPSIRVDREHGERHHVVGVERVDEAEHEGEDEPGALPGQFGEPRRDFGECVQRGVSGPALPDRGGSPIDAARPG